MTEGNATRRARGVRSRVRRGRALFGSDGAGPPASERAPVVPGGGAPRRDPVGETASGGGDGHGDRDGGREPRKRPARRWGRVDAVRGYTALLAALLPLVLAASWWVHPPSAGELSGLLVLLALGLASARLRDLGGESQIDLSFTAAILLSAIPLAGPVGAGVLGVVIPLFEARRAGLAATVFNSAMTGLVGAISGLGYVAAGGWVPVPSDGAGGRELLLHVGLPLLAADVLLCVVNAALVAVMIRLHAPPGTRFELEPFIAPLPVYLGYAVTAFVFVVLWGPGGLHVLTAAFIVAPLLVARWAYLQYIGQVKARQRILDTLAAAGENRDGSVARNLRIAALVRVFELHVPLSRRGEAALRYGASLHDIGIVAISREIRQRRPEELTDAELATVRSHADTGYEAIRDIDFLGDAAAAVRHHHERWDGSGYPDGLSGLAIPRPARMLGIVDAYEALAWEDDTTCPVHHDAAMAEIHRRSGRDFDPQLVEAFDRAMSSPAGRRLVTEGVDTGPVQRRSGRRPPLRHASPFVGDAISRAQERADAAGSTGSTGWAGSSASTASTGSAASTESAGSDEGATRPVLTPAARTSIADSLALIVPSAARSSAAADPLDGAAERATGRLAWVVASVAVLLLVVLAVSGDRPHAEYAERTVLLVYFVTLLAAERFRMRLRWRLQTAPTAWAAGMALALTIGLPANSPLRLDTSSILAVVVAAQVVDWFTVRRGAPAQLRREALTDAVIRSTSVLCVCLVVRDLPWAGRPLLERLVEWAPWLTAMTMMSILSVVLLAEAPVRAWARARGGRSVLSREILEEIRGSLALGTAMAATGVLLAMAEGVLGLVAVPLLLLPLAVSQLAIGRFGRTNLAYRQSVRALSRLPELAGLVAPGHAGRVSDLAVAIGVRLGLPDREVVDLEYAALLHDIGQLALRRPLPGGATVLAAATDQERIAHNGARVVEQTGTLAEVAHIVRHQSMPYHRIIGSRIDLPLASRIVNVANAYDDYLQVGGEADPAGAIERLYLGLGHEYDPRVVRACESHVLGDRAPTPTPPHPDGP